MSKPAGRCAHCSSTIFGGNRSGYCSRCSRYYKDYRRGQRRRGFPALGREEYFQLRREQRVRRTCSNPHCRRPLSPQNASGYCYPCNKLFAGFLRDRRRRGAALLSKEEYFTQRAQGFGRTRASAMAVQRSLSDDEIRQALPQIRSIARTIRHPALRRCDFDDLVGWGVFGLLEANSRYEAERGIELLAFARSRIRGAMLNALHRLERDGFVEGVGLAEELEKVRAPAVRESMASYGENPEQLLMGKETAAVIARSMALLPNLPYRCIVLRFWEGYSVMEVAGLLSCAPESVHRYTAAGLAQLRPHLAAFAS